MSRYLKACLFIVGVTASIPSRVVAQTQLEKARAQTDSLRLASYATSHQVEQIATNEGFRGRAWEAIGRMGVTKLYVEVYRGGHAVSREQLVLVRDWLTGQGIEVVGGIATVPGGDVGVRQKGPLDWYNWQNGKTQNDVERIVRMAAGVFDAFIVDDFLCTGDVSEESDKARGSRSWGQYRRELMTQVARSVFVGPARQVNPDITMIVKYPQWYDRFHLFGYDTQTLPRLFDRVWVGTETRGRNTQRFGFVQPYEGFVNYRWLAGIAGEKIGGAWFDHGDCAEHDFLDQAYMSVLAGARELVFFNLGDVMNGHPDHAKVVEQFARLADLADFVRAHPVVGIPAYKPPNSDPGGDMYLMDFLGMLGIPLVPVHEFPDSAPVMFLPAQAAADAALTERIRAALDKGATVIVTASLLIALPHRAEVARMLGVDPNITSHPTLGRLVSNDVPVAARKSIDSKVALESLIESTEASGDLLCEADGKNVLFLRTRNTGKGRISLLNTHTYSQADFDAVGEVLLSPRQLDLLSMQGTKLLKLRAAFYGEFPGPAPAEHSRAILTSPNGGVTFHPFSMTGVAGFVLQNFNDAETTITVTLPATNGAPVRFIDRFSEREVSGGYDSGRRVISLSLSLPARGRIWVQPESEP